MERKKVRMISPARESESERCIKNLEECTEQQNQEIKKLKQQAACLKTGSNKNHGKPGNIPHFHNDVISGGPAFVPADGYSSGPGVNNSRDRPVSAQYSRGIDSPLMTGQPPTPGQTNAPYSAPRYFTQNSGVSTHTPAYASRGRRRSSTNG